MGFVLIYENKWLWSLDVHLCLVFVLFFHMPEASLHIHPNSLLISYYLCSCRTKRSREWSLSCLQSSANPLCAEMAESPAGGNEDFSEASAPVLPSSNRTATQCNYLCSLGKFNLLLFLLLCSCVLLIIHDEHRPRLFISQFPVQSYFQ